jgi:hypothetical protein
MPEKPKVKAPQKRATPSTGTGTDQRKLMIIGGVALTAVVLVAGAFFLMGSGSGTSADDVEASMTAAGCTLQTVKAQAGSHTLGPDGKAKWNTDPPTSGPHFGFNANGTVGTVIWGTYDEPVQLARIVHNLEHGGVYILYGDGVSSDVVAQLEDFAGRNENGTVLAPYPKLGDQVALGAWVADGEDGNGYLAKCPGYDADAFSDFFSAFQFRGPEAFPENQLLPGTN